MSINGDYQASKIGSTSVVAFNGSAGAAVSVELINASSDQELIVSQSFVIRVTTDARIRQGNVDTVVTATSGLMLAAGTYWRVDVEYARERYLSVLGATAAGGNIEYTSITEVAV